MKAIFIQARMGSSRLPNKVLAPFFGSMSILEIIISNAKKSRYQWPVWVATSTNAKDDSIEDLCKKMDVNCFRGPEDDVLKRFIDLAEKVDADTVIRICADNPFLNIDLIDSLIEQHLVKPNADYISYFTPDNTPTIKTHWGLFAELVSAKALKMIDQKTHEKIFREHVTNFIYTHPQSFNIVKLPLPQFMQGKEGLRFTVDNPDDFNAMKALYQRFFPNFNLPEIISYVESQPDILRGMKENINKYTK
jgi:spore coat polysaccharide biosynthesis protein SpsF